MLSNKEKVGDLDLNTTGSWLAEFQKTIKDLQLRYFYDQNNNNQLKEKSNYVKLNNFSFLEGYCHMPDST